MGDCVADVVRRLVQEGQKVRAEFYTVLEEPNEQRLGPPADPSKIQAIESLLGTPLPPTYRAFLELYDGWKMIDATTDLLSCDEVLAVLRSRPVIAATGGEFDPAVALPIGCSENGRGHYYLDPRQHVDGEMAVVDHDGDVHEIYPSFLEFLDQSNADYAELAEESSFGGTL